MQVCYIYTSVCISQVNKKQSQEEVRVKKSVVKNWLMGFGKLVQTYRAIRKDGQKASGIEMAIHSLEHRWHLSSFSWEASMHHF